MLNVPSVSQSSGRNAISDYRIIEDVEAIYVFDRGYYD